MMMFLRMVTCTIGNTVVAFFKQSSGILQKTLSKCKKSLDFYTVVLQSRFELCTSQVVMWFIIALPVCSLTLLVCTSLEVLSLLTRRETVRLD